MNRVYLHEILDVPSLERAIKDKLIMMRPHESAGLFILDYSVSAQYARNWTHEIRTCRGLIISGLPSDPDTYVVARPFPKFGNIGEYGPTSSFGELPLHLPFEATDKLDGSLAITYFDGEKIALSTRGAFHSDQAKAASALWQKRFSDVAIPDGVTLLFEYVAPWNRVVVAYEQEDLVFLGALDIRSGADVSFDAWHGTRARVFGSSNFDELVEIAKNDPNPSDEGFVIRFVPEDPSTQSVRVKLKYAEYLRVHKLMTEISSITIWEHLSEGKSLALMLEDVPDEFYEFIRETSDSLTRGYAALVAGATALYEEVKDLDRKSAAAIVTGQREIDSSLVFGLLSGYDISLNVWRLLRPEHSVPKYG